MRQSGVIAVPATDDTTPWSSNAPRTPGAPSVDMAAAVEFPDPVFACATGVVVSAPGTANICILDVPLLVTLGADSEPPATLRNQ
jgi:hypothetical protein